mgnify:CR=1 FL=1
MEFEILIDKKGKEHMVLNSMDIENNLSIGDKFSDFEILQPLGKGGFAKVIKVCSLINHRIYAMKIIDLNNNDKFTANLLDMEKYYNNEIELITKLNHQNIVKYYKSFTENNKIYIIMEYFDNGDLDNYIKALKEDKNKEENIKKEEIWNIFYQCMSGLNYLHSMGVIHRDISPQNIFMTKNKIIKIGDFGVSAKFKDKEILKKITSLKDTVVGKAEFMAPEVSNKCYNEKSDIFSMGCVFYKILFLKNYQNETFHFGGNNKNIRKVESGIIPSISDINLKEILTQMLEKDAEIRPDAKIVFEKIKENYNKVFIQNSGLYSVIRCLCNLPYLRSHFLDKFKKEKKEFIGSKPYSKNLLYCIENKDNWLETINFYRSNLIEENHFLNNNKEINPILILTFIIDKIHGELNQIKPRETYLRKRSSFNDPIKEDKINRDYVSNFSANFNSNISNNFVGHFETIRKCNSCSILTYLFTFFFSLEFDLNLPLLLKKKKTEIDLIELFKMQNEINLDLKGKFRCLKCEKEVEHKESKIFYLFPYQLVVSFDRGNNDENKININYPKELNLSEIVKDKKYSPKHFNLLGIIKRCDIKTKEHYISLIFNKEEKSWYLFDDENMQKLEDYSNHKGGDVVMLFYVANK